MGGQLHNCPGSCGQEPQLPVSAMCSARPMSAARLSFILLVLQTPTRVLLWASGPVLAIDLSSRHRERSLLSQSPRSH